jgi:hypothetical protein
VRLLVLLQEINPSLLWHVCPILAAATDRVVPLGARRPGFSRTLCRLRQEEPQPGKEAQHTARDADAGKFAADHQPSQQVGIDRDTQNKRAQGGR